MNPRTITALVKVFAGARPGSDDRELRWTAAGITYAQPSPSGANIWSQPVEGGPPRQVTHFEGASIVEHAWSRDGRSLVFTRGTANNDVILIANPAGRQ